MRGKPVTAYVINPAVAYREVEGQIMFLLPDDYDIFTLNASGKWVWLELVSNRTPQEIAQGLASKYGIPLPQARQDVDTLIQEFLSRRILIPGS